MVFLLAAAGARAGTPLTQGFEDGAPAWQASGMWHVQPDPQDITVIPAIRDQLVTLPDDGSLPAPAEGASVAWFGEAATGTYCGSDYATVKQTPQDGCTSTAAHEGALTSPSFSLEGRSGAYFVFRAWWEIEAVQADVADQMRVEYSTDAGGSWHSAGSLNPLDPAWGGKHQSFSDGGARASGSWQSYAADLSPAAGAPDVRVRFVFDSVDALRNGFRGLLVDGVAVVDPLGATIIEDGAGPFTDSPPELSVKDTVLVQDPDGHWIVHFTIVASHPPTHTVGVDWTVRGHSGTEVVTGRAVIDAGQAETDVTVSVSGNDAPYTVGIDNPTGGTIAPGGGSSPTPGGAVPLVGINSLGVRALDGGQAAVDLGLGLTPAAALAVSVDYTVTGSDGVQVGAGTLIVPAGSTSVATTITVGAEHAPYTIALSNPRGALLDPSGATATTSPLAVAPLATAAQDPGSQLVLGVRQTGGGPVLDRTFILSAVSGTVRYHRPGETFTTLGSGSITLPLGSVVDATAGHALITVDIDGNGTLQEVEVWDGKFGVFQVGKPAIAELRLAGGDYSVCAGSARKRARRSAGTKTVRHLWAQAKGRFRTKGRFASATVRGTKWLTEDLCLATRITVAEGIVAVRDFRRQKTSLVRAGNSLTIGALQSARFRHRRGVHPPRLSGVRPG